MRTLVTGGAGFIGSHLVDALLARGDTVTVVDDLSSGRESNLAAALASGAELERADIRDGAALAAIVAAARPQTVFHLAAQVDVRRSLADPGFDARTNVEGTINVLEAARAAGSERVVFSSTGGAIYGETDILPTPETAPALPMAAYGQSKRCAELYLGALRAPVRAVDARAALRQRLRPAPGPARRGRRHRDLLREDARRACGRASSATARRRATTSTSAISSTRSCAPATCATAAS